MCRLQIIKENGGNLAWIRGYGYGEREKMHARTWMRKRKKERKGRVLWGETELLMVV